jgi:Carboxypeptidase regulatory-like domain/TonB dependent receptor
MKLALLILCAGLAAQAQVATSSLAGTVRDQSSGTVAGAVVTATQTATGFIRSTTSDLHGNYVFDQLAPGIYTLTATKAGFRNYQASDVAIELSQGVKHDIALAVGAAQDKLTVEGAVSPVDTEGAAEGYLLDHSKIADLPLASRNVVSLVTLGPGAIPRQLNGFSHDVNNDVQEGSRGSVALNAPINGSRSTMNSFLIDGAYDTDRNTFAIAVYPPMDSVEEFRIQSSLAHAEFPESGGGAIDVITKSGTRQIHGSGFEYLGNEATDAKNFFETNAFPRAIFRQNQFGASLGGPVPFLKNTFFYGIYEGLRKRQGGSRASLVPTQAARNGDFSGTGTVIYDPLSANTAGARTPFPQDKIPTPEIDKIATTFLNTYQPLPNSNGAGGNYLDSTPNATNTDSASGRIDHQFSNHSVLNGRYTFNGEGNVVAGSFPLLPLSEQVRAQQATVAYIASGNTWINEARASFTRLRLYDVPETAFKTNVAQQLGLADPPTDPFYFGLPYFNVTNYSMVTDSPTLPQVQRDNLYEMSNGLSLVRGRHTLKFGGDLIHSQLNYLQSNNARGTYVYSGVFTSSDGLGTNSGNALADFLLGDPQDTNRTTGSGQAYMRQNIAGLYAQDDWRINSQLTINFGVRYNYASPYSEARDNFLNLNYSSLPQAPTLQRVSSATVPQRLNFAPRAGLAWQLPKLPIPGRATVLRAGYGIYYSPEIAVESYDLLLNGLSNVANETQGTQRPVLTTQNAFAKTAVSGFPSYFGVDPNVPTPYVQQWTLSLQHELPRRVLLEIAYVGSKGTHLGRYRQFNTPAHVELGQNLAPRPGDLQSLRSFPTLGPITQRQHIANSSYDSLQVKVEKSLSSRVSVLASFVWAKSIDDADGVIPGLYDSVGAQDERNLRLERGLSFFNVGRRISAGYVWRLPETSVAGPVLRRWQLSGTVTLQDGTPEDPYYFAVDYANSGTPNRPNIVPGQSVALPRDQRTIEHWFNTAAFSAPAPFTFGNAGRDTIIGPGINIFDLAIDRRFRILEGHTLEFRAESFNVFNHPNWGIPLNNPDFGPFFGQIHVTGDPRRMQFVVRYDF